VTDLGTSQRRGDGAPDGAPAPERGFRLWPPQVAFDVGPLAAKARAVGASLTPRSLWRNHRLFTIAALVSVVPRVIAAIGFKPSVAMPAAKVTACCSAIAVSNVRVGNSFITLLSPVPSGIAAVSATMRSSSFIKSIVACANTAV